MSTLHYRMARLEDAGLYYEWANDAQVRKNSFNQDVIIYEDHINWFKNKLASADCFMYLFLNEHGIPVGQVRIDRSGSEIIIGISIDRNFRGRGFGTLMLEQSCEDYLSKHVNARILAYIKEENEASIAAFRKAGFSGTEYADVNGINSVKLSKSRA